MVQSGATPTTLTGDDDEDDPPIVMMNDVVSEEEEDSTNMNNPRDDRDGQHHQSSCHERPWSCSIHLYSPMPREWRTRRMIVFIIKYVEVAAVVME